MLTAGQVNVIVKVWPFPADDSDTVIVRVVTGRSNVREGPSSLVTVMRVAEAGGVGAPVLAA